MKKILLVLLVGIMMLSCTVHSEIEQRVSVDSIIEDTYYVQTWVWIRKWNSMPVTIEESYFQSGVKKNEIESHKSFQMAKAIEVQKNVDSILKLRK